MVTEKCFLGTFLNSVIVAFGPVLFVYGFYLAYFYYIFKLFIEPIIWIIPLNIGITGLLAILIAIFGFCGGSLNYKCPYYFVLFLIASSFINSGNYWLLIKDDNHILVDKSMDHTYNNSDQAVERFTWLALQSIFDCCSVNGPVDFTEAGKEVPKECFTGRRLHTEGCKASLDKHVTRDMLIITSISMAAGILILVIMMTGYCMDFDNDAEFVVGPGYYEDMELDEYYQYPQCYCQSSPPCGCQNCQIQNQFPNSQIQTVPNYPNQPYPNSGLQIPCTRSRTMTTCRQMITMQPQLCPAPAPVPQMCVMALPQAVNPPIITSTPTTQIVSNTQSVPVSGPVIQEQQRPIQLQIPDMSFFSSLLPSSRRHRRRSHHRRHNGRSSQQQRMSIVPMNSGNGFMVCTNPSDGSDDSD